MSDDQKHSNVVKLSERRKRGSAIHRRGASARQQPKSPSKFWAALQLGLFLILVAYFVRQC